MELTPHEQQALDEIARQLPDEDPVLAAEPSGMSDHWFRNFLAALGEQPPLGGH